MQLALRAIHDYDERGFYMRRSAAAAIRQIRTLTHIIDIMMRRAKRVIPIPISPLNPAR